MINSIQKMRITGNWFSRQSAELMEGWVYVRFSKMRPLFKGVHYYLVMPLPAPTNQGGTVFKGEYYLRKYGIWHCHILEG